ncbi:hypothetical protein [Candidatus Enterococcus clewellii]|uniref:Uncharacterized protein n=1 Tax=Candidatus Enterococcus clewellii TaxID=1834193 RepID=A0AAQ3VX11_9ENTE
MAKRVKKNEMEIVKKYFDALDELEGVVQNRNGSGAIGEWIACQIHKDLVLEKNKRNEGFDGKKEGKKVEVKLFDSKIRTNIIINDSQKFDDLIVVVRKGSYLDVQKEKEPVDFFVHYIEDYSKKYGNANVAKRILEKNKPEEFSFIENNMKP